MDATMNTADARISCSPPSRPWVAWLAGKAGDRIHISSGMVAMRLIVMELGRVMNLVTSPSLGLPRQVPRRSPRKGGSLLPRQNAPAGALENRAQADTSILPHRAPGHQRGLAAAQRISGDRA